MGSQLTFSEQLKRLRTTLEELARNAWGFVISSTVQLAHKISTARINIQARSRKLWAKARASASVWAVRTRLGLVRFWRRHLRKIDFLIYFVVAFLFIYSLNTLWRPLDAYIGEIGKSVLPELAIGVGAGITGMIAIVFSLSLFAIQQVADKAAPQILTEYAHDRLLALYFFVLAGLATISFAAALIKSDRDYRTTVTVCLLSMLVMSFCFLRVHFRRVTKFVDPRYTILRIRSRGLKQIQKVRKTVGAAVKATQKATF